MTDLSAASVAARLRAAGCVFAEDEAELLLGEARAGGDLDAMIARRAAGVPLEQVVGWASFCGVRIAVEPGVFVPRRRTELLAREAVARCLPGATVVDLCCGAAAIAVVVASLVPDVEVHAADVDPAAVRCARRNVRGLGAPVHEGDLFDALPATLRGRVDVLVANTPYVPTGEIATLPAEAREHEPALALDGGSDGLDVQRRVAAAVGEWLVPGGHVLVEVTAQQAPVAAELFRDRGLTPATCRDDATGAVVVVATSPA